MLIRKATAEDWPAIWPFFHQIVAAGATFPYPLDVDEEEARGMWLVPDPGRVVVAVDTTGAVVGTANMYANRAGNGSHIASASYMVDPAHQGRGAGRALCEDSLTWAQAAGFSAMVFNAVVETNVQAVKLYESLGFTVLGTVPKGFRHPDKGYVGLHMMHRSL
ncbi:GNAT family N-acetyltransferase [Actinomadura rugatobispora]|uniref:GNAT family N-acetyltransferase n=1 Tax=Actinomadura rugatobispora TaxID=1994 RepID=A0ABW1A5C8_9ACTN|nr:GNAT family N-acetyltransferase [Actinomadura rugatobispora]